MKLKIIALLTVLLSCTLAASPNKCCKGMRCGSKVEKQEAAATAGSTGMIIDDGELLPGHLFFYNF